MTSRQLHQENLINALNLYNSLGYSVIPVASNKRPILPWKPAQQKQLNKDLIESTIRNNPKTRGLGIVTGIVSGLAILDFDKISYYEVFITRYPELAKTYTVKTRRGYHLYYRIRPNQRTKTIKGKGADWLYHGAYAVAPPSICNGVQYEVSRVLEPRRLSNDEIGYIQNFISKKKKYRRVEFFDMPQMANYDIRNYYKQNRDNGRNNALFYSAIRARDGHWTPQRARKILLPMFINDNPNGESRKQRAREGRATIRSAYSRPQSYRQAKRETGSLPNSIREALLARKLTAVVRTIETLREKGIRPGDTFTQTTAMDHLTGIVGRHSMLKTIQTLKNWVMPNGIAKKTTKKCFLVCRSKPNLNTRGRPTLYYTMPSNAELAKFLNVEISPSSDSLSEDDLSSAKHTRQAMHREFIRRCPGTYPSAWLAERLAVSITTKNRYDNAIGVYKVPTYIDKPVTLESCGHLPEGETRGIFLEDERGKRYPVIIRLAHTLLLRGLRVILRQQSYNMYSMTPIEEPKPVFAIPKMVNIVQHARARLANPKADIYSIALTREKDEKLAKHVHYTLDQASFTLSSARRLVSNYGARAVEVALAQLQHKRHVKNPAGLLTTLVRAVK